MANTIVLLDPDASFAAELTMALADEFSVRLARDLPEAGGICAEPEVVGALLCMQQEANGHGLEAALWLRGRPGGGQQLIVVYDRSEAGPPPSSWRDIERKYSVDLFVGHRYSVPRIEEVVRLPFRRKAAAMDAARRSVESTATDCGGGVVSAKASRDLQQDSLRELLRRSVSRESVRELLRRKVGLEELARSTPEEHDASWGELLRSEATPENFRRLLRKRIELPTGEFPKVSDIED